MDFLFRFSVALLNQCIEFSPKNRNRAPCFDADLDSATPDA